MSAKDAVLVEIADALRARWGDDRIVTEPTRLAPHLEEWRRRGSGVTPFMAEPRTVEEVAELVGLCAARGAPITPQGGNTGLVLGQIPQGEILLSLRRMNAVRLVDAEADAMVAEAGVVLAAAQDAARGAGRQFPLSLAAEGSATIGGLVSTNAGGVHVVRYGMMRDLVLGLEVVLPSGEVLRALEPLRKNNTGYDLKQLFIGAEGTLGVVTAATLRLFPLARSRVVALAALGSPERAIALLHKLKSETGALSAFEIMNKRSIELAQALPDVRVPFALSPWTALAEFEASDDGLEVRVEAALAGAHETGLILDARVAPSLAAQKEFWRIRESLPAGHRLLPNPQVSLDVSTPVSDVPEFLRRAEAAVAESFPGADIVAFGHAGDGNIHYTVLGPSESFDKAAAGRAIHEIAVSLGGSISAEHGIGVARKEDFVRFKDPTAIAAMRQVKAALDPRNIMNPRLLFP